MEFQLTTTTELQQKPILSYTQIQAVRVLQYPAQELHQYLTDSIGDNPALEGEENDLCPICHYPLLGDGLHCDCALNQRLAREHDDGTADNRDDWETSMLSVKSGGSFDEDDDDPLARVSGRAEYGAGLLMALRAMLPASEHDIAEYLVGSLNSYGLLPPAIIEEAAAALERSSGAIAYVLAALQQLDPPGVGARTPREALLLQIARLREQDFSRNLDLAEDLIRYHFEDLAAKHFREIARALGTTPRIIEGEHQFIREHLHPYPAHGYDPDLSGIAVSAPPVRPDVVLRRTAHGYEADIVEQRRWNLHLSDSYRQVRQQMGKDPMLGTTSEREHIRRSLDKATSLLAALKQRWHTMQRVADALIDLQHDYLDRGPAGLKPLTRKDVGDIINLHESTVSRATDGKFVLLPNGKTVPFDNFFNDSLLVKDAITDLIEEEDIRHPFSDEQLTTILNERGLAVARRTVAKYREEMDILPSRLRRNRFAPKRQRVAISC